MSGFASTTLSVSESLTRLNTNQNAAVATPVKGEIGISSETVAKWIVPSQAVDNLALDLFNKTTQRKLDIVTNGGNTGLASACYSADTAVVTTLYGDLVTGVGVTYGPLVGVVGVGTTTNVAFGVINYDTLQAYNYPKLESDTLDVSGNNPMEGEGYVNITSSNIGIGERTVYTVGAGSSVGTVYALQSSGCAAYTGIAASITSLRSQYDTESAGIVTYVADANVIKGYKHAAQLEYWSLNKVSNNLTVGVSSNTSVISLLDQYS